MPPSLLFWFRSSGVQLRGYSRCLEIENCQQVYCLPKKSWSVHFLDLWEKKETGTVILVVDRRLKNSGCIILGLEQKTKNYMFVSIYIT
jgi:hypothetical protein